MSKDYERPLFYAVNLSRCREPHCEKPTEVQICNYRNEPVSDWCKKHGIVELRRLTAIRPGDPH